VKQLEILENIKVPKKFIKNIVDNNKYNEDTIINYYYVLQSEFDSLNFSNKIDNISSCNSHWLLDVYNNQRIKDFKKTNLCKDKFCNNCKKVKQAARLAKFAPVIENLKKDYNLFHLVLTNPNCTGEDLEADIKKMFKNFFKLNRYLKQDAKIKGIDFGLYGYVGGIRSLEVTFESDSYHPHLHCIIALDKDVKLDKTITNKYSYSYGKLNRLFSDFEVLIQKIWYLLHNGQKVTKKAIDELTEGYSCVSDTIDESSYHEVFKYMTKGTDEEKNILTYDNFKTLYFALHGVRQIQGYGLFYNIKDDDSIVEKVDEIYNSILEELQKKEVPVESRQKPLELLSDNEFTLISRKKIYSYLREL